MSELATMIRDSASRLFADICTREALEAAERTGWAGGAWNALMELGLPAAAAPEERGGVGLGVADLCALLRVAGAHALPLPLAETWLGERMLAAAGLAPAEECAGATVGPVIVGERLQLMRGRDGWRLDGRLHRIPFGRAAGTLVLLAESDDGTRTLRLTERIAAGHGKNYADEPRDALEFTGVPIPDVDVGDAGQGYHYSALASDGALFRSAQMAGAMERVLEMTVRYATERVQFGRPIANFQAVQQQIAVLAGQVAAARAATDGAAEARGDGPAGFESACAKIRVGEAAGVVAAIAHQVHGAIGFTYEHSLHHYTRRLWAWRDEFGSEAEWARWVGRIVAEVGGDGLWPYLTSPVQTSSMARLW